MGSSPSASRIRRRTRLDSLAECLWVESAGGCQFLPAYAVGALVEQLELGRRGAGFDSGKLFADLHNPGWSGARLRQVFEGGGGTGSGIDPGEIALGGSESPDLVAQAIAADRFQVAFQSSHVAELDSLAANLGDHSGEYGLDQVLTVDLTLKGSDHLRDAKHAAQVRLKVLDKGGCGALVSRPN